MRTTLIALLAVTLLASSAIYLVHNQNQTEDLEKIHIPHIHIPHIHVGKLHLKIHWSNLGKCAGVVTGAAKSCGASISSDGADIVGDIKCVKNLLHSGSCHHIF